MHYLKYQEKQQMPLKFKQTSSIDEQQGQCK
jgi:hypothetical protein